MRGLLAHSFDKFYVITKFILPTLDDLKLSPIRYNQDCKYTCNLDDQNNEQITQYKGLTFILCKIETIHDIL